MAAPLTYATGAGDLNRMLRLAGRRSSRADVRLTRSRPDRRGRRHGAAALPASTSSSTGWREAPHGPGGAGRSRRPSITCWTGSASSRQRRRGDRPAAAPPARHARLTSGALAGRPARDAQTELEPRSEQLEAEYPNTPAGLGVTVAWGLPYFQRLVPGRRRRTSRSTAATSRADGKPVRGADRRDPLPQRSGDDRPGAQRRGAAAAQRQPQRTSPTRPNELRRAGGVWRPDEHPPGLRRRRVRRRPGAAASGWRWRRGSRARS